MDKIIEKAINIITGFVVSSVLTFMWQEYLTSQEINPVPMKILYLVVLFSSVYYFVVRHY